MQMASVNIPQAYHKTELGTLDPAMFSLMRTDVEASFPTEITWGTCRIKSHLSCEIGLCTTALCHAKRLDSSLALFHHVSLKQERKAH